MADVALLLLASVFNMAACVAVVLWDRKRLPAEQRERAWNTASFASAVFAFSPWCLLAHFWVTRRTLKGVLLGVLWLIVVLIALVLFNLTAAWILGIEG